MFEHKRYVYEVYKAKSFSKAAANMFISQPSLSLTIKKTENMIGSPLFDRSTSPIRMTECGMEYIRTAERIMDLENAFETYLSDLDALHTGSVSLGASNFFASYILPPVITLFKERYPRLEVRLLEADTVNLEQRLGDGELDLIIDNYDLDESVFRKRFFYSEQMILAVPASLPCNRRASKYALSAEDIQAGKHKLADTPAAPLELFDGAPFLAMRFGNDTRERIDRILSENGIRPHVVLELDQLATAYHVACRGMGATLVSDTLVREIPPDPRLVFYRIGSRHVDRDIWFYHRKTKYLTRAMEAFLDTALHSRSQ